MHGLRMVSPRTLKKYRACRGHTSDSDGVERPKKRFRRTPSRHLFQKPSASPAVFDHQDSPTSSVEVLSEAPSSPVSIHSFSPPMSIEQETPPTPTPSSTKNTLLWPGDYHAVDIVRFFADCSDHPDRPNKTIFEEHFPGVPFRRSTSSENRRRWSTAPQSIRDQVLAAKRSPKGLWSFFQSQTRFA